MFELADFDQRFLEEIDSTNSEAVRLIEAGAIDRPTLILAKVQTAGRGSRGRGWESASGNLHATYVLPELEPSKQASLLVYPIALAVGNSIREAIGSAAEVLLKWPNDILIDGRKVSGALLEVGTFGGRAFLVAGIGVNLRWAPSASESLYPPAALSEFVAEPVSAEELAVLIGTGLLRELALFQRNGFADTRRRYEARSAFLGEEIVIRGKPPAAELARGTYLGIADDGALLLETPTGVTRHYSADLFPALGGL